MSVRNLLFRNKYLKQVINKKKQGFQKQFDVYTYQDTQAGYRVDIIMIVLFFFHQESICCKRCKPIGTLPPPQMTPPLVLW